MSNNLFPALRGLEWNVERTPLFNTLLFEAASGKDATCALWSFPRYQYKMSYSWLNDNVTQDMRTLVGFFNLALGQWDSWLYKDPIDNSVTGQSIGTGTGSLATFQLVRTWGPSSSFPFVEPIQNLNGNPQIYVNGTLQTLTTNYTVGPTGIITFTSGHIPGSGAAVTATFNWYYRCRFLKDMITLNQFMNGLWENKSLEFETVKL
jgi:uncharacterized protein (TIGR02217 family)